MDKDLRNILILVGIVASMFLLFLGSCSVQNHNCKVEGIKAGMKAEDVNTACRV